MSSICPSTRVNQTDLLVERSALKSERVDDVVDLGSTVLQSLGFFLGRWVTSYTDCQLTIVVKCRCDAPMSTSPSLTMIMEQSTS